MSADPQTTRMLAEYRHQKRAVAQWSVEQLGHLVDLRQIAESAYADGGGEQVLASMDRSIQHLSEAVTAAGWGAT